MTRWNPLNWYSAVKDGQTYYASIIKEKVESVRRQTFIRFSEKSGFCLIWRAGFATRLAAYGQALQASAAARQTDTYAAPDAYAAANTSYNTTTQQIGGVGYSNTTSSAGTSYNTTTQRNRQR